MAEKNKGGLFEAMTFKQGAVPFAASWIGVVFVAMVAWQLAYMAGITKTGALAVAGVGAGYQAQEAPVSGASNQLPDCGSQKPTAQMLTYYYDPNNNNQYTLVSTNSYVYMAGSPTALSTVVTSASGVNQTTAGELSCGSTVREIAGTGNAYYYARTSDFVVDNAVVPAPNGGKGLEVIPSGAVTLYVKDPTTNYNGSITEYNWTSAGFGAGGTNSGNLMVKVQSPTTPAMFGDLGFALCFRYNSYNFTSVSAIGGSSVGIQHVKATSALDTVSCYSFAPLALGENREIALYLKGTSTGPTVAGTTIDVIAVDKTNELYNGYLIPDENAKAGVSGNGYDLINTPNTGTGRADVTTTSALVIVR